MEEEKYNMLPYLDVLVENGLFSFTSSVYHMSTFTGLYTSLDTFDPKFWKINHVKCWKLIGHWWFIPKVGPIRKLKMITDIFLRNGYPDNAISSRIRSMISLFKSIKSFGLSRCPVYVKIPWVGVVSLFFFLIKSPG